MMDNLITELAVMIPDAKSRGALPGVFRVGLSRGLLEIRVFFRNRTALVMNMALPITLMLLFGTLFTMKLSGHNFSMRDIAVAGVVASGIMSAGFGTLAMTVALETNDGAVKRLRGTPFSDASYFIAKALLVVVISLVQTVLILVVAAAVFGMVPLMDMPHLLTFAWVFVLGAVSTAFLGIAVASLVTDRRSIAAVVQFPFIVLQFLSGVYYAFAALPLVLQIPGEIFPLKWMAQGMRAALLPPAAVRIEVGGSWHLDQVALVLSAWVVGGFILCLLARRYRMRREFL
jgi:ABC-2 type transport system permease protein